MLFAMRDVMQATSWTRASAVAVVFDVVVVAAVRFYDRAVRGPAAARGTEA